MEKYEIVSPKGRGSFLERLCELYMSVGNYMDMEALEGRRLQYAKVFLSDAQNQYQQFVESELYKEIISGAASTIVEQAPLDGSKVAVLLKTSDKDADFLFQCMRLTEEETKGNSSYVQTVTLFEKYIKGITELGLDMRTHLVRTWIYVADIDVNYDGVVKARNDIFKSYGLTAETHFVASTGIGGCSQTRPACVAMDFLTYPNIKEEDKTYLKALDHLNPTHEYGVAFERGTRLAVDGKHMFFISGTASIDKHGNVVYVGDVTRQTARLLENIGALLKDGGATMKDVNYFVIYLRDLSDYSAVEEFMSKTFPTVPRILLHAKVCRPQWLIEMECTATTSIENLL